MGDVLICGFCGRQMLMVMDTPLCPVCSRDVIYELQVHVREDLKNMKKKVEGGKK